MIEYIQGKRKMTGRIREEPRVVLGFREDGRPGVTIHLDYDAYGCYDDPETIAKFIEDLQAAYGHLRMESKE